MTVYKTYFAILILSALTSAALVPFAQSLASKIGAVDLPNERKIHTAPMPRLGGVAVIAGFFLPWLIFYLLDNRVSLEFQNYEKLLLGLTCCTGLMMALGIYDDTKGADAFKKFVIQSIVALTLYVLGFRILQISNPFGEPIQLGWLSIPVTALWIVGIVNAVNLLDGLDGLVAGVTIIISISIGVLNMLSDQVVVALMAFGLAGACLGFLPHNFHPAKIFLGDSGSLTIGLILACIGILSSYKAATATFVATPLSLIIVFGLPIYDTTSVMLKRFLRKQPIFLADKSHVHHSLLRRGWRQTKTTLFLYIVTTCLVGAPVLLAITHSPMFAVAVSGGVLAFTVIIMYFRKQRRLRNGSNVQSEPSQDPAA